MGRKKNNKKKAGNAAKPATAHEPVIGGSMNEAMAHLKGMTEETDGAMVVNYQETEDGLHADIPGLGVSGTLDPNSYLARKYGKKPETDPEHNPLIDGEGSLGVPPATDSPVQREKKLNEMTKEERDAVMKRIGDELEKSYPHCKECGQTLPFDPKGELAQRLSATFPRPVRFDRLVPPQFRYQVWAMLQPTMLDERKNPLCIMAMVYAFADINEAQAYRDYFATSEGAIACGIDQCYVTVEDAFNGVPCPLREYWDTHHVFRNEELNSVYQRTFDKTVRARHVAETQLKAEVPNMQGNPRFVLPQDSRIAKQRSAAREGSLASAMQMNSGAVGSNVGRYMGASSSTGRQ